MDLIVSPYFYRSHGIHFRKRVKVKFVFIQLLFGLFSHKNPWLVFSRTCWEDGESARRKPIKCWCTSMKFSPAGQGFLAEPPPVVDTSLVLMSAAPPPRRTWAHLERVIHQPEGWSFPWIRSKHRTNPDFYCLFNGRSVWLHVPAWTSAGTACTNTGALGNLCWFWSLSAKLINPRY